MCSAFLWSGSPNITSKAKISWEEVCTLKEEGGLGVRRIKDVVHVFSLKLIWQLFEASDFLWAAWVRTYLIRNESFWDVKEREVGSWVWKKLLKLRLLAQKFLRMEIHNGKSIRFWTDLWHPLGRLIDLVGDRGPQQLGVMQNATIDEVFVGNEWRFRNCRDSTIRGLAERIKEYRIHLVTDVEDGLTEYQSLFSSGETWNLVRTQGEFKEWSKAVWFNQGVPRFSYITWMAVKDILATCSRMRSWGQIQGCVFCGEPEESRDHLYFACPYTFTLWLEVTGTLLSNGASPDWTTTLQYLTARPHDYLSSILVRLVFQVSVYYIWIEKNELRHNHRTRAVGQLARIIDKVVRNRITSTRYHEWFSTHS